MALVYDAVIREHKAQTIADAKIYEYAVLSCSLETINAWFETEEKEKFKNLGIFYGDY